MKVWILGFPRTATTGLYAYYSKLVDHKFYEPFNGEVVLDLIRGRHVHDVVGRIEHTYYIDTDVWKLVVDNSRWFWKWTFDEEPEEPWLGRRFWEIVEAIDRRNSYVVKDVIAWTELPELVEELEDVIFVCPIRDFESLLKSYLHRWRRNNIVWQLIRRRRIDPKSRAAMKSTWALGLGLFHKRFFGEGVPTWNLAMFIKALKRCYSKYLELILKAREKGGGRVVVIPWRRRLSQPYPLRRGK